MVLSLASIEQRARSLFSEESWGNALTWTLSGITTSHQIPLQMALYANGDSDRLNNNMHFLSCIALKDFPLRRDFGNKLIKPF